MNKKQFLIICGFIVLILVAILVFIFLNKKDTSTSTTNNDNNTATLPTSPSLPVVIPQNPSATTSNTSNQNVSGDCSGLISIERDDCITKKASVSKNTKLCSDIQNASARAYCLGTSSIKTTSSNTKVLSPYVTVAQTQNNQSQTPKTSVDSLSLGVSLGDIESQVNSFMGETTINPVAEFFDRMATKTKLLLFIVNPTEVKPGSTAKATGSGFTKTGNTVFIGNESITNLSSSDGMNISFTVPNIPEGRYETWVTNSNGSSKRPQFAIYVTIANNATPPPTALAVSPEAPKLSDTITVSGENLSNVAGVYTSMGTASGLSFKLQDLQFYSLLQKSLADNPIIKGIPLVIMVMTKSGLSEPLMVNVTP